MSDHSELKRLADACPPPGTYHYQSKEWANLMEFQAAVEEIYESDVGMAKDLIAEIEQLKHQADSRRKLHARECAAMTEVQGDLINERDQLKAENDRQAKEIEALRKAVEFGADCFRKISSGDGSGHADLAECILRIAGSAMSEGAKP